MFQLETERLYIRRWQAEDVTPFHAITGDVEMMRHIGSGDVWSLEKTRGWIERQLAMHEKQGFGRWKLVLKETNQLAGFCGVAYIGTTEEVEIGWWIARPLWGKGLASEAAVFVKNYALGDLGISHLISVCTPENVASLRIMQKIGLRLREKTTAEKLGLPHGDLPVIVYTSEPRDE